MTKPEAPEWSQGSIIWKMSYGWVLPSACAVVCTRRLLSTFRSSLNRYLEMKMLNVEAGCYTSACFCQGQDLLPHCPEFMLFPQHSLHGTGMHSSAVRSQRGRQSCVLLEDLLQPAPRSGCSVNKDWALGTWYSLLCHVGLQEAQLYALNLLLC